MSGLASAGDHRREARGHRQQQRQSGRLHPCGRTYQIPMRHMAGFMRHHAGDLIGRVQGHQQTGVEEHMLAFGNEGIDRRIIHQMQLDILGHQAGRYQDRVELGPQHTFGFGVADQRYALALRVRGVGQQRQQRDHQKSRNEKPEKGPQTGKSAFQRSILLRTHPSGGTVGFASNAVNARQMTLSSRNRLPGFFRRVPNSWVHILKRRCHQPLRASCGAASTSSERSGSREASTWVSEPMSSMAMAGIFSSWIACAALSGKDGL